MKQAPFDLLQAVEHVFCESQYLSSFHSGINHVYFGYTIANNKDRDEIQKKRQILRVCTIC